MTTSATPATPIDDLEVFEPNGPDDYLHCYKDGAIAFALATALPAHETAIADAVETVDAVKFDAPPAELLEQVEAACEAISWLSSDAAREIQENRLRTAAHGQISIDTIRHDITRLIQDRKAERDAFLATMAAISQPAVLGADVAVEIECFLRKYFVLDEHYYPILVTWTLHAHLITPHAAKLQIMDHTVYLIITSPAKRCGKTNLVIALSLMTPRAWVTQNTSVGNLARKVGDQRCTMYIDEIDLLLKGAQEFVAALTGILNSGSSRNGIYSRCIGEGANLKSADFSTFCPKCLAGIKASRLAETVTDRSLVVRAKRKSKAAKVERFRSKAVNPEGEAIRQRAEQWATKARVDLADKEGTCIEELHDRAWDACEILVRIAEYIGGDWPTRLQAALLEVYGAESVQDDVSTQLLRDCKAVFGAAGHLPTADLLAALKQIETSPWADWRDGKGLTSGGLSRLLEPFGIIPRQIWIGGRNVRGYFREMFSDAWERYLDPASMSPPPIQKSKALGTLEPNNDADLLPFSDPLGNETLADEKSAQSPHEQRCLASLAGCNSTNQREGASQDVGATTTPVPREGYL